MGSRGMGVGLLARIHRRTPMDGVRKAEGGEGATGEIAWFHLG